jgi:hypothetical protein
MVLKTLIYNNKREKMNLYNSDEYYQLTNEVVDYLEQWPQLSTAQRDRAVSIGVAMKTFYDKGPYFRSVTLPDGSYDDRGFELDLRHKILERSPLTAAHASQARAELAALVQQQIDGMKSCGSEA